MLSQVALTCNPITFNLARKMRPHQAAHSHWPITWKCSLPFPRDPSYAEVFSVKRYRYDRGFCFWYYMTY